MGLDMYAFTTATSLTQPVDFGEPTDVEQLHYWRKHPNLHGWMEALYIAKGGKEEDFNLSAVKLDSADLDQLETDILNRALPYTVGFFFGISDGSEREDDLQFIGEARAAIAEGKTLFYIASW